LSINSARYFTTFHQGGIVAHSLLGKLQEHKTKRKSPPPRVLENPIAQINLSRRG